MGNLNAETMDVPTLKFMQNLRSIIRLHQLALIENPDPDDEWWFLVDPTAEVPVDLTD